MLNRLILLVLALASISHCSMLTSRRSVETFVNPQCEKENACSQPNEKGSYYNLLYVRANGTNDTMHIFYSSINTFTIMMFKTEPSAMLEINWDNLLSEDRLKMSDSIVFHGESNDTVLYKCGFAFPHVYEFNDVNGTANMTLVPNDSNYLFTHNTADFIWRNLTINSTSENIGTFSGYYPDNPNGLFKFLVRFTGQESSRDNYLPHLLLNDDASSIDFIIDGVQPHFNYSKFALNIFMLTEFSNVTQQVKSNLDDEYTPGTFDTYNVIVANDETNHINNYLEWKPIFYYFLPRTLENSTITKQYKMRNMDQTIPDGIGLNYFGVDQLVSSINVSFGLEGNRKDGYYYDQTKYSAWTFSIGFGSAPIDTMSNIVKLVITIGFGLPVVVILLGITVMIVKKLRYSNRSNFSAL